MKEWFSVAIGVVGIAVITLCLLSFWSCQKERTDPTSKALNALNQELAKQTALLEKISTYTRDATVCLMYMIQSAQGQTMPEPQAPEKPKFRAEIPSRPSSPAFSF